MESIDNALCVYLCKKDNLKYESTHTQRKVFKLKLNKIHSDIYHF